MEDQELCIGKSKSIIYVTILQNEPEVTTATANQ